MAEARTRVFNEIHAFTGRAYHKVIDPDLCLMTTNMEVNLDGSIRARQRKPEDQGATLVFPWKDRETVVAVDCFFELEQNIAAIASALEAIRRLHRLDASMMDQAMAGFQALPNPGAISQSHWKTALGFSMEDEVNFEQAKHRYRVCMSRAHTDKGGNHETAAKINMAWSDAKAHFGKS